MIFGFIDWLVTPNLRICFKPKSGATPNESVEEHPDRGKLH